MKPHIYIKSVYIYICIYMSIRFQDYSSIKGSPGSLGDLLVVGTGQGGDILQGATRFYVAVSVNCWDL